MLKGPKIQICCIDENSSIFDEYIKWCVNDKVLDLNMLPSSKEIVNSIAVFARNTMAYEIDNKLNRMLIKERFQYILERFSEKFEVNFDNSNQYNIYNILYVL